MIHNVSNNTIKKSGVRGCPPQTKKKKIEVQKKNSQKKQVIIFKNKFIYLMFMPFLVLSLYALLLEFILSAFQSFPQFIIFLG